MTFIYYEPETVWDIFQSIKAKPDPDDTVELAENPDFGVSIVLSCDYFGTNLLPNIIVYMDDMELYSEIVVNEGDCRKTVDNIYRDYLYDERLVSAVVDREMKELEEKTFMEDEIEQRDGELYDAVSDMLDVFMNADNFGWPVSSRESDEIITDLIENIGEYLYREHDISIYRPMILEDGDGEEFFEEYPYDCMEFDE